MSPGTPDSGSDKSQASTLKKCKGITATSTTQPQGALGGHEKPICLTCAPISASMSAAVFIARNRRGDAWFSVGLASSFPNITESGSETVAGPRSCGDGEAPGCKVYQVPKEDSSLASEVDPSDVAEAAFAARELRDQVLVFQYKGKFHAVNNQCPHSSFPLSNGTPFDIEDFGIVLSAGISCPKHGWSFDLFSGQGDRGNYRLKLWEVQLRAVPGKPADDEEREVWVRKKQRMG